MNQPITSDMIREAEDFCSPKTIKEMKKLYAIQQEQQKVLADIFISNERREQ